MSRSQDEGFDFLGRYANNPRYFHVWKKRTLTSLMIKGVQWVIKDLVPELDPHVDNTHNERQKFNSSCEIALATIYASLGEQAQGDVSDAYDNEELTTRNKARQIFVILQASHDSFREVAIAEIKTDMSRL